MKMSRPCMHRFRLICALMMFSVGRFSSTFAFLPPSSQTPFKSSHHKVRDNILTKENNMPIVLKSKNPRNSQRLHAIPAETVVKSFANIEALLVLTGVITFHELGHFFAARIQGIRIENFSIGFGPEIYWVKPKDGVRYSLRAIPLGGFVSFPRRIDEGADVDEMVNEKEAVVIDPEDPDLLDNRPPLQRIFVISAGVIANLLLSFSLILGTATTIGVAKPHFEQGVAISQIIDKSGPATVAGLSEKDKILAINGKPLPATDKALSQAVDAIRGSEGDPLSFTIQRGDSIITKSVTARAGGAGSNYGIGVMLSNNIDRVDKVRYTNLAEASSFAFFEVVNQCATILDNLKRLVSTGNAGDLSGPLGVVEVGSQMARDNTAALIGFAAAISINLAVVNALPIPALDGGQFTFVLLEVLSRRKLDRQFVENVNIFFFLVLIGFSVSALVGDVERLSGLNK